MQLQSWKRSEYYHISISMKLRLSSIYIDNIMNLELLFEVNNLTKNQTLHDIAWQYAHITMYENFRENNGNYHIVEYNQTSCHAIRKYIGQG